MVNLEQLSEIEIFKGVKKEEIKKLFDSINYKTKIVEKGNTVAFRGEEIRELIIIGEGEVHTEMQNLNGDSIIVDKLSSGSVLAGAFIFGKDNRFPVDVIANIKTELIYIPKKELLKLFQVNEELLLKYLEVISNKTQFLSKKIWFSFNNKSINNKLIAYLLNNMNRDNCVILKNSIKEIAQMFGVARPSLSRVLKNFVDEGILIRVNRNTLKISSKKELLSKVGR